MAANSVDPKDINFGQFLRLFGNATGYELSKRLKQYADRNNHPKLSQFADSFTGKLIKLNIIKL